ncbi:hypothetical protein GCM10007304_46690 [Rhodococcoides trifolii]|uniref:NACHT domain-containing protein n=1 Tax=Rhodococcoides trifolii TaxID=908250 RepID=A0A917LI91_9NOCA|nr:hypothetical protein GCM10007304_46690 [Rhodococcus trifolii]
MLIGAPGSGKSSFLMFAAADILAAEPQSAPLQRAHGGDLPLWLPFGFLCRHLDGSTTNSVLSAIEAWVTQQGGSSDWHLAQPALDDERAILLVDGIDEWTDPASAEHALGLIESFVSQRSIGAILTARPYALDRLNWVESWDKAALAPLTRPQQIALVTRVLSESDTTGVEVPSNPHAESFLTELGQVSALSSLLATPLFLGLLAKSWRGESLPPQRFRLFSALVRLLVDKHPQMRRRASSAAGSDFSTVEMLTVLRGVAYQSRIDGGSAIRTRQEMTHRFRHELRREDGLAYPPADAARVATAVLSQAEDEYGLLVPQGAGMVGFLHRVLLDQLAGEHLATLTPDEQQCTLTVRAGDPTWRDVLIAALATQVNAHVNTSLLTHLSGHPDVDPDDRYELIAEAIAADVAITTNKQSQWVSEIVDRVDGHSDTVHRARLIESLVSMTKQASLRSRLLTTFTRWLNAAHPEPTSPLWMLRDSAVAEAGVLPALLWGLRHEEEAVQLNAAHALAVRYAGDGAVGARIEANIYEGANAIDQAFALLSLGTGWPDWPQLPTLLAWARVQRTPELRVCAVHLLHQVAGGGFDYLTDEEKQWFGGLLRHDRIRPRDHWRDLAMPFVQHAVSEQPTAAHRVLEILSDNERTGGDQSMAWLLACTTFSEDAAIRNWVIDELKHPDRDRLRWFNLTMIPESWRADPEFVRSIARTLRDDSVKIPFNEGLVALAELSADDEALDALLPALDSWRPGYVAAALLRRFRDRPDVRAVFEERLYGSVETAAPLAQFALEVLGNAEGFRVLVELLRSSAVDDREKRVVVATAVADAWVRFVNAPDEPESAAIMKGYDPDELATRCVAVGTDYLLWHVGSVIGAWPSHPAVVAFALAALRHPRYISSGVQDPTPPAIVRAYGARVDATATTMMNAVLDQLAYLPPHLREVLVDALTRSDLTPAALRDLLGDWSEDPDVWVQRTALTGIIRRIERYRISPNAVQTPEEVNDWVRLQVRSELSGYGPIHDNRRQTGWVGMLMLADFGLHDDLRETIGEPTRPGVRLQHWAGGVDRELVDLINTKWDELFAHFGDDLFVLLSATNVRDVPKNPRARVLGYLSTSSSPHPAVDELIREEAEANSQFRSSAEYLIWAHRRGRRDLDLFVACMASVGSLTSNQRETDGLYDLLVDLNSWQFSADALRQVFVQQPGFETKPVLRALFCELFPTDERSRTMFAELEEWFRVGDSRQRREWVDTLAIAVRLAPASVLPVIVERALQILFWDTADVFPLVTGPLLRRLRSDPDAVSAFRSAIENPASADTSTVIWAGPVGHERAQDATASTQRAYLAASVLRHTGLLNENTAATARDALAANPDVVVSEPFTGVERSAHSALANLIRPQSRRDWGL